MNTPNEEPLARRDVDLEGVADARRECEVLRTEIKALEKWVRDLRDDLVKVRTERDTLLDEAEEPCPHSDLAWFDLQTERDNWRSIALTVCNLILRERDPK